MAGDWIKMRSCLDTSPEVFQMAQMLNMDELSVVGRLWKLWSWADQHTVSGDDVSVTNVTLEKITNTPGFADALRKVGWLTGRDGLLSFPNFERHNGQTAKNRALTKDRMRKMRDDNVTHGASLEKRREENGKIVFTREAVILSGKQQGIPEEVCIAFYDRKESVGWVDSNGVPIHSMPHSLASYWRTWQSNNAEKAAKNGTHPQRTSKFAW